MEFVIRLWLISELNKEKYIAYSEQFSNKQGRMSFSHNPGYMLYRTERIVIALYDAESNKLEYLRGIDLLTKSLWRAFFLGEHHGGVKFWNLPPPPGK